VHALAHSRFVDRADPHGGIGMRGDPFERRLDRVGR